MNPYLKGSQAYRKAAVNTHDQGTLIVMMYEGMLKFLRQSLIKLEKNDFEGTHTGIVKAKAILAELLASLNIENTGQIGQGLLQLYNYMYNRLVEANVQKNKEIIEEVIRLLETLYEGWKIVAQKNKNEKSTKQMTMKRKTNIKG